MKNNNDRTFRLVYPRKSIVNLGFAAVDNVFSGTNLLYHPLIYVLFILTHPCGSLHLVPPCILANKSGSQSMQPCRHACWSWIIINVMGNCNMYISRTQIFRRHTGSHLWNSISIDKKMYRPILLMNLLFRLKISDMFNGDWLVRNKEIQL